MLADTASAVAMIRGDSARAAAAVYTIVLLSCLPFLAAAIASVALRRVAASARVLVWRCTIVALLVLFIGRALPLHALAWAVPPTLAAPLVAIGRVQVAAGSFAPLASLVGMDGPDAGSRTAILVQALVVMYVAGVMMILIPTVLASVRARRDLRGAVAMSDAASSIDELRRILGVGRRVRVFVSSTAEVPMTWGLMAPVIVLPSAATGWSRAERRIVLLHELTHVRAADWAFGLAARVVCALFWFHPGAWWLARTLRADCELACDARVIAAGVRRSDYADVLVRAAEALCTGRVPHGAALALSQRAGLRARLAAVLDVQRETRAPARAWAPVAAAVTVVMAGPMSAVQLAPTRDVLTTLMRDARWESRAYAVLGLAQRQDSIAVARSAAERDPSPRVRAWARYALDRNAERPVDILIPAHTQER